jgi:hypothetical protein
MDIPLYPDGFAPKSKDEVQIEEIEIAVYPDRFRVFVHIRVTPFSERPNLILTARNAHGKIAGELNIIETMHFDMEFTMHLRTGGQDPAGKYTLQADLFYESRNPPQSHRTKAFIVPDASDL